MGLCQPWYFALRPDHARLQDQALSLGNTISAFRAGVGGEKKQCDQIWRFFSIVLGYLFIIFDAL